MTSGTALAGLIFVLLVSSGFGLSDDKRMRRDASADTSKILNNLLANYDRRLRPQFGGDPVMVNVSFYVTSMGPLDTKEMTMKLDMLFRQYWVDTRLAFESDGPITVGAKFAGEIWTPGLVLAAPALEVCYSWRNLVKILVKV